MDAAQGWAAPPAVKNETLNEMELFGAPSALIEELKKDQHIEILPVNWPVVCWFVEVCDLFKYRAIDGMCLGLDLLQIESEARLSERVFKKEDFAGLRVMSRGIAQTLAAK